VENKADGLGGLPNLKCSGRFIPLQDSAIIYTGLFVKEGFGINISVSVKVSNMSLSIVYGLW